MIGRQFNADESHASSYLMLPSAKLNYAFLRSEISPFRARASRRGLFRWYTLVLVILIFLSSSPSLFLPSFFLLIRHARRHLLYFINLFASCIFVFQRAIGQFCFFLSLLDLVRSVRLVRQRGNLTRGTTCRVVVPTTPKLNSIQQPVFVRQHRV